MFNHVFLFGQVHPHKNFMEDAFISLGVIVNTDKHSQKHDLLGREVMKHLSH